MFVDEVDVLVAAGKGGRGSISFRREKFIPRGGPDGGDGGPGGSVYLVASPHHNTLVNFRFHPEFSAEPGGNGSGSNRTGKTGKDLYLDVPVGTTAYAIRGGAGQPTLDDDGDGEDDDFDGDVEAAEAVDAGDTAPREMVQVADLTAVGQTALVAKGGRGGRGNARFVSSTNRSPRRSDPGDEGDIVKLHLRLKLLADVGLIGFPNAGKSTLIARISAAKPKIADYPFTTLTPNLGVVSLDDDRSFVVADVPGLIEGAHEGHGLGHRFLGHVERTKVLLHLVDVSSGSGRDPVDDFEIIRRELALYTPPNETHADRVSLADRPQIVVANKIDALDDPDRLASLKARAAELGLAFHAISGATGEGIGELLEATWQYVAAGRALAHAPIVAAEAEDEDTGVEAASIDENRVSEARDAEERDAVAGAAGAGAVGAGTVEHGGPAIGGASVASGAGDAGAAGKNEAARAQVSRGRAAEREARPRPKARRVMPDETEVTGSGHGQMSLTQRLVAPRPRKPRDPDA
jgi:GTP-binding protein